MRKSEPSLLWSLFSFSSFQPLPEKSVWMCGMLMFLTAP